MSITFNGKDYAEKKKILLRSSIGLLREQGIIPHLATIIIGSNQTSTKYSNLKKKFLESLGCEVDIYTLPEKAELEEIKLLIKTLNEDCTVHGVMIQMPISEQLKNKKEEIVNLIEQNKDVDGLQDNSRYIHPTSKAVLEILSLAILETKIEPITICVVGASGMVGKPLVKELKKLGYIVLEADIKTDNAILQGLTLQSDVIVSATGSMNLVTPEMIQENSIVIDVGSPFGDVRPEVQEKTSFVTPVPNGVGPVTITCLAENLIIASNAI